MISIPAPVGIPSFDSSVTLCDLCLPVQAKRCPSQNHPRGARAALRACLRPAVSLVSPSGRVRL